ncbi:MAG: heme-binding protein [Candidatus Saccharibacteria bacterium]|nr:heme-binding protein [Pseudorhodobacter sp.]
MACLIWTGCSHRSTIWSATGPIIGAVGVSGDTADMDEDCAMTGIARPT